MPSDRIGKVSINFVNSYTGRNTADIFNQRKTKHHGYGPQFTQLQMANCLVCLQIESARFLSTLSIAIRAETRRIFSISARRSIMGMDHNSPNFKWVTVWYAFRSNRQGFYQLCQ